MTEDQNCVATKVASENPMKKRHSRNEVNPSASAMPKTAGAVPSIRKAWPYLGPKVSHTTPMTIRQKMVPVTAAIPALPRSGLVRSRLFLMTGIIGAAAKVDRNEVKKLIHDRWKALMCGLAMDRSLIFFALCSVSTGRSKVFPLKSLGTSSFSMFMIAQQRLLGVVFTLPLGRRSSSSVGSAVVARSNAKSERRSQFCL
mmetsp:Transcript_7655/g.26370  ORF Transcript_7655/g.26370 Transcript_7655/m.26370 type:complete len:200 (-) Transcript_7655:62-661(-)